MQVFCFFWYALVCLQTCFGVGLGARCLICLANSSVEFAHANLHVQRGVKQFYRSQLYTALEQMTVSANVLGEQVLACMVAGQGLMLTLYGRTRLGLLAFILLV